MIHGVFETESGNFSGDFESGVLLSEAADTCGVRLNLACGSKGTCGRCGVNAVAGEFEDINDKGRSIAADGQLLLACKTVALSNFCVKVPPTSLLADSGKVLVNFEQLPQWNNSCGIRTHMLELPQPSQADSLGDADRIARALDLSGENMPLISRRVLNQIHTACVDNNYKLAVSVADLPDGRKRILRAIGQHDYHGDFGLAIDIGTTSVVCALVYLADGRIVDSAGSFNMQVRRCADVASRITAASTPDGLADMHRLITDDTLAANIDRLCAHSGLVRDDILRISVGANTVMTHLFMGLDPRGLGAVPFTPVVNSPASMTAGDLALAANADADVIIAPAIGGYVGGDISADMVACDFTIGRGKILLVDIGTNAEIVACCGEKILACAAPAGPAFEGQGTACGMRATAGAVDAVTIDPQTGKCDYSVIAGADAAGICGSGFIDFIAQAWGCGIINMAGRFDADKLDSLGVKLAEASGPNGKTLPAFEIAPGVVVTESDIAAILQAKGVIRAAIDTLLKRLGLSADELDQLYLAGGFARHLNMKNTLAIGMLPELDESRITFIGNGSLAGAYLALMDTEKHAAMIAAAAAPEMVELNLDPDFQDAYIISMMLGM